MTGQSHTPTASDIRHGDWIDRRAPRSVQPYLRLARIDRAIGTWLLLLPCWWGLALASVATPDVSPLRALVYAVLFAIGALVMRGAGCTWNDIMDRDFDARVARTALRPIPSGAVSVRQVYVFLGLQLLMGLVVLLCFNAVTILVGIASLLLVVIYPQMKRVTYWPQLFLGLAFNWGALVGWTAIAGGLSAPPLLLYVAGIFWTLGYDTIYAHQDKEDDVLIGVKSSALRLGANTRPWLWIFYAATVALLAAAFWQAALGWPSYLLLALAAAMLGHQATAVDLDDPVDCRVKFNATRYSGFVVTAAILAGGISLV